MGRAWRTMGRGRWVLVAAATVSASTGCLPTPVEVVGFGCGESFAADDSEGVEAYIESLYPGFAAGFASPPPVIFSNLQALSSVNATALGRLMAGVWVDADLEAAVVGVVGDVADVTTLIDATAPHPDEVVIEDRNADAGVAEAIWDDIVAAGVDDEARQGAQLVGFLRNGLVVNLPPTAAAAELADGIRAEHGNRVSINVGPRRLAGGPEFDAGDCLVSQPRWVIGSTIPDNVVISTVLDDATVTPGQPVTGRIDVTYNGAGEAYVYPPDGSYCELVNQPLTTPDRQFAVNGSTIGHAPDVQQVFDFGERWPLRYTNGRAEAPWSVPYDRPGEGGGDCDDSGLFGPIGTGETLSIPFTADTVSSRPGDATLLPAGRYLLRPMLWIQTVISFGQAPTALPPVQVEIVAPAR